MRLLGEDVGGESTFGENLSKKMDGGDERTPAMISRVAMQGALSPSRANWLTLPGMELAPASPAAR